MFAPCVNDEWEDKALLKALHPMCGARCNAWEPDRLSEDFVRRFVEPPPLDLSINVEEEDDDEDEVMALWIDTAVDILIESGITQVTEEEFDCAIKGLESGDDRADMAKSPVVLALAISAQSVLMKMKTSEKDTFISHWLFNYCEITSQSPMSPLKGFHAWKKGTSPDMDFSDLARMRVLMDTYASNNPHASRKAGKLGMHGRSVATCHSDLRPIQNIAQFFQAGMVLAERSPEPTYLPRSLGGSGAPALFQESDNLWLATLTMRGGSMSRVYGSATKEAQQAVENYDSNRPVFTPLLDKLRMKGDYLHGTYAGKILIMPTSLTDAGLQKVAMPVIKAKAITPLHAGIISRLQSAKILVSATQANLELAKTARLNELVFGAFSVEDVKKEEQRESQARQKAMGGSFHANCNMARLLEKKATPADVRALEEQGYLTSDAGVREFTRAHAQWIFDGCKGETCSIDDLISMEDQYLMADVSSETSMKVPGIDLLARTTGRKQRVRETVAKIGLWQVETETHKWATKIGEELKSSRDEGYSAYSVDQIFWNNRELVADDKMIMSHIEERIKGSKLRANIHVLLITDDKRLCKQLVRVLGITLHRMTSTNFCYSMGESCDFKIETYNRLDPKRFSINRAKSGVRVVSGPPNMVVVDSGSVAAALARMDHEELPQGFAAEPEILSEVRHKDGTRTSEVYWKFQTLPRDHFRIKGTYRPQGSKRGTTDQRYRQYSRRRFRAKAL